MIISRVTGKLSQVKDVIQTSFWFIPIVFILLSFLALYVTYHFDKMRFFESSALLKLMYSIEPEGARTILSTIATSIMAATSIAFSMVVVTLTLASSQFGPRLLRNFMQDRKTQMALGVFVATFVYCVILIRFVSVDITNPFVPGAGLTLSMVLTLISIFALVFLIHHVAISIQADNVVAHCWRGLVNDIDRIFPCSNEAKTAESPKIDWTELPVCIALQAQSNGYIHLIDYDALRHYLEKHNLGVTLDVVAGDYLIEDASVGSLHCIEHANVSRSKIDDILQFIVVGKGRTPIQDPRFAINQIVELALRALSPGINDPFTAISCLHHLGSALSIVAKRPFPMQNIKDASGLVRISCRVPRFDELVNTSFEQIRQASNSHPRVMIEMIEVLHKCYITIDNIHHKTSLACHIDLIYKSAEHVNMLDEDLAQIAAKIDAFNTVRGND